MYEQNFEDRKYEDPDTKEYRNCLDALILMVHEAKVLAEHRHSLSAMQLVYKGERIAADMAHIIMRKYINMQDSDSQSREEPETRENTGRKFYSYLEHKMVPYKDTV